MADHVHDLVEPHDDHARKVRDIFAVRCEQDGWPGEVRACVVATRSLDEPRGCKAKLTAPQRAALERELDEADRAARIAKLTGCERYKYRIEQIMACDRLPQASRDALKQGFDAMSQSWEQMKDMPQEAREAMESACTQGAEALEQATKDLCGP